MPRSNSLFPRRHWRQIPLSHENKMLRRVTPIAILPLVLCTQSAFASEKENYPGIVDTAYGVACLKQDKSFSAAEIKKYEFSSLDKLKIRLVDYYSAMDRKTFLDDVMKKFGERGGSKGCIAFAEEIRRSQRFSSGTSQYAIPRSNGIHERCRDAADYSGCASTYSRETNASRRGGCQPEKWCYPNPRTDVVGMPTVDGWMMYESPQRRYVAYRRPGAQKVNVRGETNRYFALEYIVRTWREGTPGTPSSTTTIGNTSADCYSYGNTVSCTVTPPTTITTPGIPATAPRVVVQTMHSIFDCKERTMANHMNYRSKGKWSKANQTQQYRFEKYCPIIESLELSRFGAYAK